MKKMKWSYGSLIAFVLFISSLVSAQVLNVDCSGTNPDPTVFPSITAALANVAGPGATILVGNAPCRENVYIGGLYNFSLGAYWGQTATIYGNLSINSSDNVYLYGLNVTNAMGLGIDIVHSHPVILDSCSSNGNASDGLNARTADIDLSNSNSFDNNGGSGINGSAYTVFNSGSMDISNNKGPGMFISGGGLFFNLGNTTILNNAGDSGGSFGLVLHGAAKAQFGTCTGANLIQGNQDGGVYLDENSEISFWPCGSGITTIAGNGPVGISAGYGSQVTLINTQITGHAGPGVDLFGKSQLNIETASGQPSNLISQNGTAGDPRSAAIVVDGNSEAFLRGGQIKSNMGPAILALVNSSADFTGVTFIGNSGGIISCDSSSYMVSDLADATHGVSVGCRTPHSLGNHRVAPFGHGNIPDLTALRKKQAQYRALAVPKKSH